MPCHDTNTNHTDLAETQKNIQKHKESHVIAKNITHKYKNTYNHTACDAMPCHATNHTEPGRITQKHNASQKFRIIAQTLHILTQTIT